MEATYLMIGDNVGKKATYVHQDGHLDDILIPVTVSAVGVYVDVRYYENGKEINEFIHPGDLYPIPLSEEILKENGFVGSVRDCYKYNCGCYLIDVRCEVGEIDIYGEKGHWTSGYVYKSINVGSLKYVHELQHALRLCGLNEMGDNFKIKLLI